LLFNFTNTKEYEADEGVSKAVKGRPFKILSPLTLPLPREDRKREGKIKGGRDG